MFRPYTVMGALSRPSLLLGPPYHWSAVHTAALHGLVRLEGTPLVSCPYCSEPRVAWSGMRAHYNGSAVHTPGSGRAGVRAHHFYGVSIVRHEVACGADLWMSGYKCIGLESGALCEWLVRCEGNLAGAYPSLIRESKGQPHI